MTELAPCAAVVPRMKRFVILPLVALLLALLMLWANRMRWLPHGLAMSAAAITLAVSAIGPQAFVMHQNVARALNPGLIAPGGHTGP